MKKTIEKAKAGNSADILRCIATLFVFLLHGRSYITKINELPSLLNWILCFPAWAGVWIFLFLSGYGVGYGFFSSKYTLYKNDKFSFKMLAKFYIGRFIKIAPLYYIYCLIFELLSSDAFLWNNSKILLKMITFSFNGSDAASGLSHLWYISLAMQLYIFMPFIFLLMNRFLKSKYVWMITLVGIVICGIFFRCYIVHKGYDWYTYSYTNCLVNVDLVALGMLTSNIKLNYAITIKKKKLIKCISGLIFGLLVMYNCFIYELNTENMLFIYRCILPTAYAICCILILLLSGDNSEDRKRSFFARIVASFSKHSYAFYIWHIAVFRYINLTLVQTVWFSERNAIVQYVIFFAVCFIINLILARIFTGISEKLLANYYKFEKKANK